MKKLIYLFLIILLLIVNVSSLSAEGSSISYDGESQGFIYESDSGKPLENLFQGCENMMPGDSITNSIKVKVTNTKNEETEIFLSCAGLLEEDMKEIFKQLKITVSVGKDKKKIYEGPASDTSDLSDWVSLGKFVGSGEVILDLTLTLPIEAGNEVAGAIGNIEWIFKAEQLSNTTTPETPDHPILPDTGDRLFVAACVTAVGSLAGLIIVIALKKKEENKEK